MDKAFDSGKNLCLVTFLVLGNYFSLFGLPHASKAERLFGESKRADAEREAKKARLWALWGLVPSTVINAALLCVLCVAAWRLGKILLGNLHAFGV